MRNTLEYIIDKLNQKAYSNEEQIRFSLVGSVLFKLGWDIWNPKEVYTEFPAVKLEDNTKVDIALFLRSDFPAVYIEIKSHTKIEQNLPAIEVQLRDYNRNNNATFTIITDGQHWRFYYSLAQGVFSNKCYHTIDLLRDNIQQLEDDFEALLSKESISTGEAENRAKKYLELSIKERIIRDSIPEAGLKMDMNPLLNKVQAIIEVMKEKGYQANDSEIIDVLQKELKVSIIRDKNTTSEFSPSPITKTNVSTTVPASSNDRGNAPTTILKVSINGQIFHDKNALNTFKDVLKFWGIERVLTSANVRSKKFPLLIPKSQVSKFPPGKYSEIDRAYSVYCNTSTGRKREFLEEIARQLGEKIRIEVVLK